MGSLTEHRPNWRPGACTAVVVVCAVCFGAPTLWARAAQTAAVPAALKPGEETHAAMYKAVSPAVVGLTCRAKLPNGRDSGFFGTGVVVSADGLILTNLSVIPDRPTEVKVYFTDGHVRDAKFLSLDSKSEGVLVKAEAKNLAFMKLAASDQYKVGDPVYSWGNPYFTIQQDGAVSLSTGTVSGLYNNSSVDFLSRYVGPVIETDAAVNPGSDGGPLTDAWGNLLGIVSLSTSTTRWLGLAVPTHVMRESLPELKALPVEPRKELGGAQRSVWAMQQAMKAVASPAEKATLGLAVVRGEGEKVFENLAQAALAAREPYPLGRDGRMDPAKINARPPGGYCTALAVDADGTAVTAAFNIEGTDVKKIYAYLPDGVRVEAKVLGQDEFYDLAVLKLALPPGRKLEFVPLADGSKLKQGQAVAVVGRNEPPGHPTLNVGQVSAAGRYQNTHCQISALINYGNMGGPVVDLDGRVVGIATQLTEKTSWRQNCGVAFMLQAQIIAKNLPDLKAGKTVEHPKLPFLGVGPDPANQPDEGTVVGTVLDDGPAAKAGLQKGDKIMQFDGQEVNGWLDLVRQIQGCAIGKKVKLKIERGEQTLDLEVEIGEKKRKDTQ